MVPPGSVALLAFVTGLGCGPGPQPAAPSPRSTPLALAIRVLAVWPHDAGAYTQGLLWHQGTLYESTGGYGASDVRRTDLESGAVLASTPLGRDHFGEGLARVGEHLVQLTWREGTAFFYDLELARIGKHSYSGEGWGLCFDGERLAMSDGSDTLVFRDPQSFAAVAQLAVTREGRPQGQLNELECAEGWIYANVYPSDEIVRIDPLSGEVVATIDASGLLDESERLHAEVLNGIAYVPERGTFLLTGKHWPRTFEVAFVPAE